MALRDVINGILKSRISEPESALGAAIIPTGFSTLEDFADDAAAEAGGIPVGGLYRNGSVVQVRTG